MKKKVVTRFLPSPTGNFHIGGARTALFNYLFAKQHKGSFFLRIEDTDRKRSKKEYEKTILEGLKWLGLTHDNKVVPRQSERSDVYRKFLRVLIDKGAAYEAEDSKETDGKVVRFKNPNTNITFHDEIRGDITFDTSELKDFVIARNIEEPLYHLAVVVDDDEIGVTHVIRGDDHISNTPRQILLIDALGMKRPIYAHIPLILATDRSKMSKRKGETSVTAYRDQGYLPEAFINFLALLGWHPEDNQEILSIEELVNKFDLSRVQKGGAIFDIDKLKSINKQYIGKLTDEEFVDRLRPHVSNTFNDSLLKRMVHVLRERLSVFSDFDEKEFEYLVSEPTYAESGLVWKDSDVKDTKKHLGHIQKTLTDIKEENFKADKIKEFLWDYATEEGRGNVLWPMRYALSGRDKSPDPFLLTEILGKEETLKRLKTASDKL